MLNVIKRLFGGDARARAAAGAALAAARERLEDNKPGEAAALLDTLIAREPAHAEALYLRGTAKLEAQRPREALADLARAAEIDPADPRKHFNLAFAHWQLNDVARCQASLRAALKAEPNFARAHKFLAGINVHGPLYLEVLARIQEHLRPRTYVEIGINRGESFALVRPQTRALGIDPEPLIEAPLGPNQRVFAETSDDFFAGHDVRTELGGVPLDLAFIDGMHRFEFALRDFMNIEPLCARDSTVLVHDVYPLDRDTATRDRNTTFWTGDVWRLIPLLKKHRPDLVIHTIATPPSGLAVIRNLDPESRVIAGNLAALVEEFMAVDYAVLDKGKAEMLNLHANDWGAIRSLLGKP